MLHSIIIMHNVVDHKNIKCNISQYQKTTLDILQSDVGACWVDLKFHNKDLKASYAIVLNIIQSQTRTTHPDTIVAILQENRDKIGLVQYYNTCNVIMDESGLEIFTKFLGNPLLSIDTIISVFPCTFQNQNLKKNKLVTLQLQDYRVTKNMMANVKVQSTVAEPTVTNREINITQKKSTCYRSKRRSVKRAVGIIEIAKHCQATYI